MKSILPALAAAAIFLAPIQGLAAPPSAAPQVTAADLTPFFDGLVPYAMQRGDIPGAVVVVVRDGKVIFSKGYGYADVAKRQPVLPATTLFRPGSVSKLFTWTSVMQLVQAGKLNLDADVNQYLDFKIPPKYGKPITLRNLMTHSAGFEEVILDLMVDKNSQLYPLHDYLVKRMPNRIFPPGKIIAYSNYGATLAGYIVQRVSGEPYAQYVQRHIFGPLGMTHATMVQPLPAAMQPYMAKGYVSGQPDKPVHFELVEAAPAGSASASGLDMAKFMLAYLQGGGKLLKPATVRQMFTLQLAPAPGIDGFDLGFYQENRNGQQIVGHAGDTNAFHSDLHLFPDKHIGIFLSFNSAGKAGAVESIRTNILRAFLDRYFPYSAPAETTVAHPQGDAARVSGFYQSSRRDERALRLVYALGQTGVTALPNGEVEVSSLTNPAGDPLRWREVGPLLYRQTDGQSHLRFLANPDGSIASFTTDEFIPVFIFQRVNGLTALGTLKTMLLLFIAVIIGSLLVRLAGWIARRRLHLRMDLERNEHILHAAARIGAVMFLLTMALWIVSLSGESNLLSTSLVGRLEMLYVLGVIAVLGGIAMIAEAVLRVVRGPGGILVRTGEVVVALAALYGIWLFVAFGLVSFVTNF